MLKKIKKISNKKKVIYILSIMFIIIIIATIVNVRNKHKEQVFIEQEKHRVLQYSKISDFKTTEEVAIYLDSKLISTQESDIDNIDYILKMDLKYNLDENVKNYYEKLIQYMAYVVKYKNLYIVDESKDINIIILCDSEQQSVVKYYINDIESYFERVETDKNINEYTEITKINVNTKSELLNKLLDNNWKTENINLGSAETVYRNYDIYFDEGYEVRKINGQVYNLVFNEKYKDEILDNIKVITDKQEIIKSLGKPQFEFNELIGYKTEKYYIFFANSQVSIYPVVSYNTDNIIQIIEKYKDTNNLINYIDEIKTVWKDYDIYEYNTNYVILQYTLKGVCFKYDYTAKKGIVFYNNYNGKVNSSTYIKQILDEKRGLPEKMYYSNIDLVFQEEVNRILQLEDYTENNNYKLASILNTSRNFKTTIDSKKQLRFISINKQYANSELKEIFDYGIWYNDNIFIYSVEGIGIYMYNASTYTYKTIIEGSDTFKITGISEGNKLHYDETFISLEEL